MDEVLLSAMSMRLQEFDAHLLRLDEQRKRVAQDRDAYVRVYELEKARCELHHVDVAASHEAKGIDAPEELITILRNPSVTIHDCLLAVILFLGPIDMDSLYNLLSRHDRRSTGRDPKDSLRGNLWGDRRKGMIIFEHGMYRFASDAARDAFRQKLDGITRPPLKDEEIATFEMIEGAAA